MKKITLLLLVVAGNLLVLATPPVIVFNGDTLQLSYEFTRKQCGDADASVLLPEVSGIACSRVTPGYIWMQSDDIESKIVATTASGHACQLSLFITLKNKRWDWEDMCGGVYDGKNYLFIGAFGDNEETDGNYYIHYFEEPEIPSTANSKATVQGYSIKYQYPEGKKHNAEAIMYDNISQTIYVITKVYYDVCTVYSLPMSLNYGDEMQTLTKVCDLGVKSDLGPGSKPSQGFHLVTGADISPDGSRILIKNHNNIIPKISAILLWEREGNEDISETLKRQPMEIAAYEYEWQGEAICWLDTTLFYTTSDSDGAPPIYKYISNKTTDMEDIKSVPEQSAQLIMHDGVLYIRKDTQLYSLSGEPVKK